MSDNERAAANSTAPARLVGARETHGHTQLWYIKTDVKHTLFNTFTTFMEGFFRELWVLTNKKGCNLCVWTACLESSWKLHDTRGVQLASWLTNTELWYIELDVKYNLFQHHHHVYGRIMFWWLMCFFSILIGNISYNAFNSVHKYFLNIVPRFGLPLNKCSHGYQPIP